MIAIPADQPADYTLRIAAAPIEISPKHILSSVTYNGQFPGPLLRFKEGQQTTADVYNDTDTPEQLHWHGQFVSDDVDGAAEEGTPYIPAHDMRRLTFAPRPAGFRFYHTHNRGGADLQQANTAARLARSTSSQSRSPEVTIAKFFWCSKSLSRHSAVAATWLWISLRPPRETSNWKAPANPR
jgi:hypothetical protein